MTKKILTSAFLVAALVAAPAAADKPEKSGDKGKSGQAQSKKAKSKSKGKGKIRRCSARRVGYSASGLLEAAALTRNADGTYDGTLTIAVKQTNRHARSHRNTTHTYTFDDAKLKFVVPDRDGSGAVDHADAQAGDTVKVSGKVTRAAKKKTCTTAGFTPTWKFRKATVTAPAPAEQPAA